MCKTIALNKISFQFFHIIRKLIFNKFSILVFKIEINLKLIEVVGNVIDGIVVGRVFIIDKDILVVGVLYQNVVC